MEFLAWAMYNKAPDALTTGERGAASRVVDRLRARYDLDLAPGYNPQVRCIKVCGA